MGINNNKNINMNIVFNNSSMDLPKVKEYINDHHLYAGIVVSFVVVFILGALVSFYLDNTSSRGVWNFLVFSCLFVYVCSVIWGLATKPSNNRVEFIFLIVLTGVLVGSSKNEKYFDYLLVFVLLGSLKVFMPLYNYFYGKRTVVREEEDFLSSKSIGETQALKQNSVIL